MTLIDDGGVGDDENKKKCLYPSTTIEKKANESFYLKILDLQIGFSQSE